jgi:NAD-reducing hydrogenase small subunit
MERVKLATLWFGGCAGCHMSFLDVDEFLVDIATLVEIVYSPLVDAKEYPENVDVVLVEGAVCNEEHVEMARKIRERTKIVVSFGDCAVTSNVCGMRNPLGGPEIVLQRAYVDLAAVNQGFPAAPGILPPLLDRAVPLHEIIPVDHFLPGCPPSAERIRTFLVGLLTEGKNPLTGSMIKFG